jgi:hypothetical protein
LAGVKKCGAGDNIQEMASVSPIGLEPDGLLAVIPGTAQCIVKVDREKALLHGDLLKN